MTMTKATRDCPVPLERQRNPCRRPEIETKNYLFSKIITVTRHNNGFCIGYKG